MTTPALSTRDLRRVVFAAAVGNVIEWYDFYIFGSLAAILSVQFFSKSDPVAAFLSTVALFSVGFLIRPLGAFVFGRVGDLVGRGIRRRLRSDAAERGGARPRRFSRLRPWEREPRGEGGRGPGRPRRWGRRSGG